MMLRNAADKRTADNIAEGTVGDSTENAPVGLVDRMVKAWRVVMVVTTMMIIQIC